MSALQQAIAGFNSSGKDVSSFAVAESGSTSVATLTPTFTSNSGDLIVVFSYGGNSAAITGFTRVRHTVDAQGVYTDFWHKTSTGDTTLSLTLSYSCVVMVIPGGVYSQVGAVGQTVSGNSTTAPDVTLSGQSLLLLGHSYYPPDNPLGTPAATGYTVVGSTPNQPRGATCVLKRSTSTSPSGVSVGWGSGSGNGPRNAVFLVVT